MRTFHIAALALLSLLLSACSAIVKRDGAVVGPFFTPTNVTNLPKLPAEIRRVLVLPVWGGPNLTEETLNSFDTVCQTELSRTGKFEVVPLSRQALAEITGMRQLSSVEKLPATLQKKVFALQNPYGADAVLFIDVTSYSPYTPLLVGFRVKLARVTDGEVVWAADNVFSAADQSVANSARHHAASLGTDRGRTDFNHTVLQNPERFAAYVAAATFQQLPPR
ncbi:MAG: hypothetical protein QM790_15180 [Nibricoccus sp.]